MRRRRGPGVPPDVEDRYRRRRPGLPVITQMEAMGFEVTHLYGLTENYGPATVCLWQPGLEEMPMTGKAAFMARQGVNHADAGGGRRPQPRDHGEGAGGWRDHGRADAARQHGDEGLPEEPGGQRGSLRRRLVHTGDLAVMHPDGYVEVKDRAKDIIISGGENISSLEVEEVLWQPGVMEAAVVARPDEKWGETPQAFVTLKPGRRRRPRPTSSPGAAPTSRTSNARAGGVRAVAEDLDRKDPEVRAAGTGIGNRQFTQLSLLRSRAVLSESSGARSATPSIVIPAKAVGVLTSPNALQSQRVA